MAFTLTIDGDTKNYVAGSLRLQKTTNGRTTGSFDVRSNDGSYRPAFFAEVILEKDGERLIGGLTDRHSESGTLKDRTGAHPAIVTRLNVVDFHLYAEWRAVNGTVPAGTMKSQIEWARSNYLTHYGVTLDAGQVDGPSLPERVFNYNASVQEFLNETMALTAEHGDIYVWRINHFGVLKAYQPSTEPAPFDIAEGDGNIIGDVTVEEVRDRYANRVIVRIPPKEEPGHVETWTGDGTTTTFSLQYKVNGWWRGLVTNANVEETLSSQEYAGTATWTHDPVANTITRTSAPAAGSTISMVFNGLFEGFATATVPGTAEEDIVERVIVVEEVPANETAESIAAGYLAKLSVIPKKVKYKTFVSGLEPGQSQSIVLPHRDLNIVDGIITEVVTTDYAPNDGPRVLMHTVTVTSEAATLDEWRDVVKVWSGDKLGGSAAAAPVTALGTGPIGMTGAAPPINSVQTNRNGNFYGSEHFTRDPITETIMIGIGHTPGGFDNFLNGANHVVQ